MKPLENFMVLVVDDEPLLRNALAFDLKRQGCQVLCAAGGEEAYEIVREMPVDLVMTDVRMPGGNGIDLLRRTKELKPELPVILFLTATMDLLEAQAYAMGAALVTSKPFDRKLLLAAVQRILEGLVAKPAPEPGTVSK